MDTESNTDPADDRAESILITNEAAADRYETVMNGELAYLEYRLEPGRLVLIHTEVPPDLEGHGVGSALVRRALNDAATNGLAVVPLCEFAAGYIRTHPRYLPLIAPEYRGEVTSS